LLQALDYHQGAPNGYLLLTKAATVALGPNEWALRLVALVAGVLSLTLFYALAQEFLEPNAALLALGLFAVADPLIDFASEAKQYSSDVLVALLLLLAASAFQRQSRARLWHGLAFGLLGAAAIWFAHPAVFVLAGIGISLLWLAVSRRAWSQLLPLGVMGAAWLASFAAEYLVSLRYLGHDQALLSYWASGFMPMPPLNVSWFLNTFFNVFQYSVGLTEAGLGIGALAFLYGFIIFWRSRPVALALLMSPLAVTLAASAARAYPFAGRLLLFAVPAVLIVLAAGAAGLFALLRPAPVAGFLLIGLLFLSPLYFSGYALVHPRTKEEARPVLSFLRKNWQPGDAIYLQNASQFAYDFYAPQLGLDKPPHVVGVDSDNWQTLLSDVDQEKGQPRVWFVFLHIQQPDQIVVVYLAYLDHLGTRIKAYHAPGSAVYLYDLAAASQ